MIVLNATTWSYAIQPILWKNHTHPSIQPTNQCSIEQMHPNSLQRSFGHINHIIYGNYLWMRDNFPECLTTTTTGLCLPEEYIELPCNGVFGIQEASFIGKTVFLVKNSSFKKKNNFFRRKTFLEKNNFLRKKTDSIFALNSDFFFIFMILSKMKITCSFRSSAWFCCVPLWIIK